MDWNKLNNQALLTLIGESIQLRRVKALLSQDDLARLSGVSVASIARLETGKGNLSLSNLLSLLKALSMGNELAVVFAQPASPLELADRLSGKPRERVRSPRKKPEAAASPDWKWGDEQ